ncbi:MAG TPA: alanine--glyoxylate aminotransferase family protein [Gemmatales bacterium]|nr:alanine--glyoxylate aminotransferase family protein [Gemmatales bacterium]HMP59233.1 alanine--glyoxylate aminotransferase family protein [Gemmatales bacterium]
MFKSRLLTPGPSPVPEETLLELARPVPYHRTPEARQILAEVLDGLKYVFQTQNDVIVHTASGTGAVESAQVNAVPRGGKAICAFAGRFGERWHQLWQAYGIESIPVTAPWGQAVQPGQIAQALADHPDAQAVCVVHSETSTGVKHDIEAIGAVVAASPAVLIVDGVSSTACLECRTDDWHVDLHCTGSQKALMLPPGLSFVSVSAKAWKKIEANPHRQSFYFDLIKARKKLGDPDTTFTPAHTLLRALRLSLARIRTEGIENVWKRHARLAAAARVGVQALGLQLFAHPPAEGLTTFEVPEGIEGKQLLSKLEKQFGLKLAGGQDQLQGKICRLAHMGYVDFFDTLAALSGLEMALGEMGYPVVPGTAVAAAQQTWSAGS